MTWSGKNQALTASITQEEVEAMLVQAGADYSIKRYPKNSMLFWDSEPNGYHYFLVEGMVEIYVVNSDGRKKSIDFYGPGSFIGYHILRENNLPMTTAVAREDCRVISISKESFFKTLHTCPQFADVTVRYLFGLLSMQTQEVINSSFYIASQRVPLLLIELIEEMEGGDGTDAEDKGDKSCRVLPYGNNEIAEMLGLSRNSVTASISSLQNQGVIEKQRSSIRIIDLEKLTRIAYLEHE